MILNHQWPVLVGLLILVALTRLLTFTFIIPLEAPDPSDYWLTIPISLANGEGYKGCNPDYFITCQSPIETAAREPVTVLLYAAVIRVFGWSMNVVFALQIILDMATAFLIYRIAVRLFSSAIGLASVALWAVYVPAINLVGVLHWSPTTTLVMAIFVERLLWAIDRPSRRRFVVVGLVFGTLCLTRSAYLYSLILWLPVLWWTASERRKALWNSAVFALAALLVLSPWVIRNYQVFNAFIPGTTLNGYNLFRHTHVIDDVRSLWYGDAKETRAELVARLGGRLSGSENEAELDRLYRDEALKIIQNNPGRYAELVMSRLGDGWLNLRPAQNYLSDSKFGYFTAVFDILLHSLLLLFCAPALLLASRRWLKQVWPILLLLIYSTLVYLPVTIRLEYLIPVAPYLFMVAFYGFDLVKRYRQQLVN